MTTEKETLPNQLHNLIQGSTVQQLKFLQREVRQRLHIRALQDTRSCISVLLDVDALINTTISPESKPGYQISLVGNHLRVVFPRVLWECLIPDRVMHLANSFLTRTSIGGLTGQVFIEAYPRHPENSRCVTFTMIVHDADFELHLPTGEAEKLGPLTAINKSLSQLLEEVSE